MAVTHDQRLRDVDVEAETPLLWVLREQLGLTVALALFSFVLTWAIAVPAGIRSRSQCRRRSRR